MSVKRFQCSPIFRRTPRFPGRNASPALRTVNSSLPSSPRTRRVPRFSPYPAGIYPQGTPFSAYPAGVYPQGTPFSALPCGHRPSHVRPASSSLTRPTPASDSLTSWPSNLGHKNIRPHVVPFSPITCRHFPHVVPFSPVTCGIASGYGSKKRRFEPENEEKM